MPGRIKIDIIPQDLRQEETIVQIAEALDNLDSAVSTVFDCITNRLSENSSRLSSIKERAIKLQGRLNFLQTNLNLKAVKMYSAAKYPASDTFKEYSIAVQVQPKYKDSLETIYKSPVLIGESSKANLSANNKMKNEQCQANTNLKEKLQFYHVKTDPSQNVDNKELLDDKIPPHLSSVSALLLFNSTDNPYKRSSQHAVHHVGDSQKIEDAPDSILQPWHLTEMESPSGYLYTPTLGELPLINAPLTLPDLPGIVDDERFSLDLNSQTPIAPSSAVTTPTVRLNLPSPLQSSVDEKDNIEKIKQETPNLPNLTEDMTSAQTIGPLPSPPPPIITNQPEPPPPPEPQLKSQTQMAPPPPPPPPPPPSVAQSQPETSSKKTEHSSKAKEETVDVHSNLMAAIRDAGGLGRAKLRHTAPDEKSEKRWSSASVGGDLMADLYAKLSLRRKGIAGATVGALEKTSTLIPPTPKPNEATVSDRNSATSEYDSQPDTDDWEE